MSGTDLGFSVSSGAFLVANFFAVRDAFRGRTTVTLAASVPTALFLANTAFWLLYLGQTISGAVTIVSVASWTLLAVMRIIR